MMNNLRRMYNPDILETQIIQSKKNWKANAYTKHEDIVISKLKNQSKNELLRVQQQLLRLGKRRDVGSIRQRFLKLTRNPKDKGEIILKKSFSRERWTEEEDVTVLLSAHTMTYKEMEKLFQERHIAVPSLSSKRTADAIRKRFSRLMRDKFSHTTK